MHHRGEAPHIEHKGARSCVARGSSLITLHLCDMNVIHIKILCMIQEELDTMSTKGKHLCRTLLLSSAFIIVYYTRTDAS
jgi:hypothetical protein